LNARKFHVLLSRRTNYRYTSADIHDTITEQHIHAVSNIKMDMPVLCTGNSQINLMIMVVVMRT